MSLCREDTLYRPWWVLWEFAGFLGVRITMGKKSKVEDFNYGSGKARGFLFCLIA